MVEFPAAFLSQMQVMLGDEYADFLVALEREPERGLRLNPRRGMEWDLDVVPWASDGRYAPTDLRPGRDLAHFSGGYYMQDPSAMAPARVLNALPGELVLDLCAAPGGKSGQIAAALRGEGALVSNEPDVARARALAGNLERLGVANALVVSAYPDVLAAMWPEVFDAIMVDAPCSGEGMFRRDAGARAEWTESAAAGCAQRQARILRAAAKMLRPGGRLVYSTCTFNAVENEDVVRAFLGDHDAFAPHDFELEGVGASGDGMLKLWPHKIRGEGHFVARLKKNGEAGPVHVSGQKRAAEVAFDALRDAVPGDWPRMIEGWRLRMVGNLLCALPSVLPAHDGLRVLRMGLHLCQVGKGHVKPDHALAMALAAGDVARTLALDDAAARRFVHGEALNCPEAIGGWTLVMHGGMPLGWGKAANGVLKNHVPKGIRINQ